MFDHFQITGLSIGALTTQVVGLLNNPFIVSAILATLALGLAHVIVSTVKRIVNL